MKNQCKDFVEISGIIVIIACLSSLIRVGYSIFPIIIIALQIILIILSRINNRNENI